MKRIAARIIGIFIINILYLGLFWGVVLDVYFKYGLKAYVMLVIIIHSYIITIIGLSCILTEYFYKRLKDKK